MIFCKNDGRDTIRGKKKPKVSALESNSRSRQYFDFARISRRLAVLLSVCMEYSDKQEEILRDSPFSDTVETVVDNAASATMKGFELDAQYLINSNWISTFTYGYLDAGYDAFLDQFGNDIKSNINY